MLIGKKSAGTPEPALHFVQNKQETVLVAEFSCALQVFLFRLINSALALDGLEQDCAGILVNGAFKSGKVIKRDIFKTVRQWLEIFLVFGLARSC